MWRRGCCCENSRAPWPRLSGQARHATNSNALNTALVCGLSVRQHSAGVPSIVRHSADIPMEAASAQLAASRELRQRYEDDARDASPTAGRAHADLIATARAREPSAGATPGAAPAAAASPVASGHDGDYEMWSDDEDDELEARVWREALAGACTHCCGAPQTAPESSVDTTPRYSHARYP